MRLFLVKYSHKRRAVPSVFFTFTAWVVANSVESAIHLTKTKLHAHKIEKVEDHGIIAAQEEASGDQDTQD